MNRAYKIIAYIAISSSLGYIAYEGRGDFMKDFLMNVIPLLTTIFAINMPTCALIVNELNKLNDKYSDIDVTSVSKELRYSIVIQIGFIGVLICFFILKDFLLKQECITGNELLVKYINIGVNSLAIGSFAYFLEIIGDLGKALFKLIHFNMRE